VGQFTLSFDAFRFFEDGAESSSVGLVNQGINISFDLAADFNFQLRVRLQESGGKSGATSDDFRLQYRKNEGTWTNVTTTSSNVKGFDSSDLTDGEATTNRLSGGSGSFVAGKISETGEVVDHQLTADNYTEHLYSLTLISADIALDDEIEFRVLLNGSTFTYNVVPKFTRTEAYSGVAEITAVASASTSGRRPNFYKAKVEATGEVSTSGAKRGEYSSQVESFSYIVLAGYPLEAGFWSPPLAASGELEHVFTNLKPETKYKTQVRSTIGPVHSGWSDEEEFETGPQLQPPITISATSQVSTSGSKKIGSEIYLSAASILGAEALKAVSAEADVSAAGSLQVEKYKGYAHEAVIGETAQADASGFKRVESSIQAEAQALTQSSGYKKVESNVLISEASSIDISASSSMPQDEYGTAEISAVGATASAGDKSAQSAVSISSQGQIMTTGIAALLDLGIPQNVQAMGISLSEIQLSWDEVLTADGYEYRYRRKAL